jgi:hypothetical protein
MQNRFERGRVKDWHAVRDRNARLVQDYVGGHSLRALAALYGISHERARQIIERDGPRMLRAIGRPRKQLSSGIVGGQILVTNRKQRSSREKGSRGFQTHFRMLREQAIHGAADELGIPVRQVRAVLRSCSRCARRELDPR